jgi:hypothetical protein
MEDDIVNIKLLKNFYGVKSALDNLDEKFKEFTLKKRTPKEFFGLYNKFFFELSEDAHRFFLNKSVNYAYPEGYKNPRMIEINSLKEQIKEIQRQIDSVEKEHFFFKNGIFMASTAISTDTDGTLSTAQIGDLGPHYMQSGRRRTIKSIDTYFKLKTRARKHLELISDQDFIIFVSPETLTGIPKGPDINSVQDIYLSNLEINIYPRTIEEYNGFRAEETEVFDTKTNHTNKTY